MLPKRFRIVIELGKKPQTRKELGIYVSYLGFYKTIRFLKERGIVTENGYDKKRRKIWKLTEKGKKLLYHIKQIERLLHD